MGPGSFLRDKSELSGQYLESGGRCFRLTSANRGSLSADAGSAAHFPSARNFGMQKPCESGRAGQCSGLAPVIPAGPGASVRFLQHEPCPCPAWRHKPVPVVAGSRGVRQPGESIRKLSAFFQDLRRGSGDIWPVLPRFYPVFARNMANFYAGIRDFNRMRRQSDPGSDSMRRLIPMLVLAVLLPLAAREATITCQGQQRESGEPLTGIANLTASTVRHARKRR